jgi:ABC-type uncharacterized transport system ATPase subunit
VGHGCPLRNNAKDGRKRLSLAVELTNISKRFGPVTALDSVSLHVQSGQIHAVVGENGAGKTTLMKALYGVQPPDSGEIKVDGVVRSFRSSSEAIAFGVGMVSQHYGIIPELTCLQNLILGAEGSAVISIDAAAQRADALAKKMGFQFDWNRDAADLSPAGAQKLEILKLLWRNSKIMILDEPTAMLSPADGEALFGSLRQLVDEGNTVILVTHRLPEVFGHCENVTVLRAGKKVAECAVAETNPGQLAEWIVGKRLEPTAVRQPKPGEVTLKISDLTVRGARGNDALIAANLTIRAGEIVGIAGVDGSGQRELFHALIGTAQPFRGRVELGSVNITEDSPAERIQKGLRLIPEDRHEEGVIEEWSLEENAALGLQRLAPFARRGSIDARGRASKAGEIAERFYVKFGSLKDPVASLSGGNQQRFVSARALANDPRVILAFQPARGLDLAATQNVYQGIRDECEKGAAALVVSYDLDELLENCDRVVVLNRGELFFPPVGQERDPDVIGRLMVAAE